ncbi:MAG: hypothetical protein ACOC5B_00755 [Myxococcota bacterium]
MGLTSEHGRANMIWVLRVIWAIDVAIIGMVSYGASVRLLVLTPLHNGDVLPTTAVMLAGVVPSFLVTLGFARCGWPWPDGTGLGAMSSEADFEERGLGHDR